MRDQTVIVLVGALLLPAAVNLATSGLPKNWTLVQSVMSVAAALLAAALIILNVRQRRTVAGALTLIDAVDQLAVAVRRQWEDEATVRQLNEPHPLPVSWVPVDAELVEDFQDLIKTANGWPGEPASDRASWATNTDHLGGSDNALGTVLARVPTRRLVVLGAPGAGKTMLLVRLVLDLMARRISGGPVPVLLSLASWNPAEQDLNGWLVYRLSLDYPWLRQPAPASAGTMSYVQALLHHKLIFLILDGLDEIADSARAVAVTRINDSLRPGQGVVLSSRVEEYKHIVSPATGPSVVVRGAAGVQLCDLDPCDIADYLQRDATKATAARWNAVVDALGTSTRLAQALRTPLMVSLARTIYNPRPGEHAQSLPMPAELCDTTSFDTHKEIEQHLLDAFIPAAYRQHPESPRHSRWSASQAERWFTVLARHQAQNCQNTTDLAWWEFHCAVPTSLRGVTVGSFVCLVVSIIVGLTSGGMNAIFAGAMAGLFTGIAAGAEQRHAPAEGLSWSLHEARQPFTALVPAMASLAIINLATPSFGLAGGVAIGLATGIVTWIMVGVVSTSADARTTSDPQSTLSRDRRTFWITAAVSGIAGGIGIGLGTQLIFPLPFLGWPEGIATIGIGGGIAFGLQRAAWGSFLIARFWLALRRRLPWRLMSFLADAHEQRGVLRQAGAAYQFRHAELQQRLASR